MLAPYVHVAAPLDQASPGQRLALEPDDDHHLRTVLRLRPGSEVVLADGRGSRCDAVLTRDAVEIASAPVTEPAPSTRLEVVHGLPKGRKLDEVVRVLTELGVDRITPVHADRSPVQLRGPKADKAAARWRAVARSAAGQSRRARLPVVDPPCDLADLVPGLAGTEVLAVIAHPAATVGLGSLATERETWPGRVVVGVGPESGWSDAEVERWRSVGGASVHLGRTVLRTEHAAAAICAALALALGRMD